MWLSEIYSLLTKDRRIYAVVLRVNSYRLIAFSQTGVCA